MAPLVVVAACSDDTGGAPPPLEPTGSSCVVPTDCYPGVDAGSLAGQVVCMSQVQGGYCTHTCNTDADCCAAKGECRGHPEVCSPFESTGAKYCFLSCEAASLAEAGTSDATLFCATYAGAQMGCRSTGGGSENRKICTP